MQGPYNQTYQPLGDLRLEFEARGRGRRTTAANWTWTAAIARGHLPAPWHARSLRLPRRTR